MPGGLWVVGNLFSLLAVLRGGNAVVMAQVNASALIASGLFGLLWYQEIRGSAAIGWALSAAFTAAMTILLGMEKAR